MYYLSDSIVFINTAIAPYQGSYAIVYYDMKNRIKKGWTIEWSW